jgi:2-polyprenyl-6-methoxyphenol hydroxylase-like FAD-dependent oxidoreductase
VVHLRSMPHLPAWSSSIVILLGDAIHNMTPMAGIGANTALRDARLLNQALSDVSSGRAKLVSAINNYEQQMRTYANAALDLSLRNARNAITKSKFKRAFFRALLRFVQTVPPVKDGGEGNARHPADDGGIGLMGDKVP